MPFVGTGTLFKILGTRFFTSDTSKKGTKAKNLAASEIITLPHKVVNE